MSLYSKELKKLSKLYDNGLFKTAFYKDKITSRKQLINYDEFKKIPFTYKTDVRNTSIFERSSTSLKDVYGVFSSSGTTGEKTFYIYNNKDKKVHEEFVRTFFTELDVSEEDIGAVMAPVDTGVMAHTMMWQFSTVGAGYVNCPLPTPENIIDTINKVPVTVVATRPSIASCVAYSPIIQKMAANSKVNKLLTGGGFLSEERRKLLESSWKADCYNMFGFSEMFGPMASECKKKNGLHYLDKYLMIEIVDPISGMPLSYGKAGVAVYTTLWDKGFPLLRYWTNDIMRIENKTCDCGSCMPRLFYLGRLNDCYILKNKYVFPENVENILFKYGFIGEYCVEKNKDSYLIKTEGLVSPTKKSMINELEELFESAITFKLLTPGSLNYDGHAKRFS